MKKKIISALLAAVMVFSLTACGGGSDKKSADGTYYNTYLDTDPTTMDPVKGNDTYSMGILRNIMEPLTRMEEDGDKQERKGAGAESWESNDDGTVWTFHLRDNKWSDGEPVTADDYVYGMKQTLDPEAGSPNAFYITCIKNGEAIYNGEKDVSELGVKAVDDKTLEITLEYSVPYFLSLTDTRAMYPVREDLVEKYGESYGANVESMVGCGPFKMTSWKRNSKIELEKNENYWDADSIKLDEICVKTVADAKTAVAMWEQGEVDITIVPTEMTDQYTENTEFYYTGADDYIMLNMSEDRPLANKNLRFALNYAINRTEYNKLVNNDVYDVAQRLVLPNVQAADDQTYGEAYPYTPFPAENDNDKAKEYLDAAMKEMGVSNPADIKITLLTTDTDGAKKQAEVLQEQYQKNLGIKVEINQVTYKQRLQMETEKDYDMVVTGWVPDYSDAYSYLELWISDSQYNHSGYANAEYDKLLKDSQTETDAKTRQDMLFQAEKIFLEEDSALVPLQLRRDQYLINPKISNFKVYFVGYDFDLVYADISE